MHHVPSYKNTYHQLGLDDHFFAADEQVISRSCHEFLSGVLDQKNVFLTKSCTQSLELAIMILDLPTNSEVILPSYGFVSLANAVAMFGHTCVFVDCEADTMNISADAIEDAISPRTKAVITINYGGVSCCDYSRIREICDVNGLWLIEDNAHGLFTRFQDRPLGTFGDIATFSFDPLKIITAYEGGAIVINNETLTQKASSCLEMGTNKDDFRKGKVPYYEWTSIGTNANLALPLQSILLRQFEQSTTILEWFTQAWNYYYQGLKPLFSEGIIDGPKIDPDVTINGYIFWVITGSGKERNELINTAQSKGITLNPHYSALHASKYGNANHRFSGQMQNTDKAVARMVRLPLFFGISRSEQDQVLKMIHEFYSGSAS